MYMATKEVFRIQLEAKEIQLVFPVLLLFLFNLCFKELRLFFQMIMSLC